MNLGKKIAVLDVSKNRIGLIISDNSGSFAAYKFLIKDNFREELKKINLIHNPALFVVGLPSYGPNVNYIKNFCHSMRDLIKPFEFVNEDLSSEYAKEYVKTYKKKINLDILASMKIFENYLHKNYIKNEI